MTGLVAEGEHVVVQCRGKVTTRSGKRCGNHCCYVCRIADGKLRALTGCMDTELATSALGAP
jgi:ketosteroid isomerase-like protein